MKLCSVQRYLLFASTLLAGWPLARAADAVPAAVAAQEPATAISHAGTAAQMGSQLVQLLFGLLLVIGLIFLLAWLARRVQQQLPGSKSSDTIQLLATRPLGPRERLLLVQVGKEQVLLGLTPGSIETLHVLQEPVTVDRSEVQSAGVFARRLRQALQQTDNDDRESR